MAAVSAVPGGYPVSEMVEEMKEGKMDRFTAEEFMAETQTRLADLEAVQSAILSGKAGHQAKQMPEVVAKEVDYLQSQLVQI